MTNYSRKSRWSWAMYDWANSVFATTVMAGFFPLFFKQYWSQDTPVTQSTFYLGLGNSIASFAIVLSAPVLGAIADRGSLRKRMLASFAAAGALATAGLFLVSQGQWPAAIVLYAVGVIGFSGANIFYDALMVLVTPDEDRHKVSALGFSLGYLGGGILFFINVLMTLKPHWFGLADATQAVRWSFITVAVWWSIFTIPLLINVREPAPNHDTSSWHFSTAFRATLKTAKDIFQYKQLALFLCAYWLYIDGVATIIRMAVDYGLALGFDANMLITALLLVQFVGFPATLVFGHIGQKYGARVGIWLALWAYVGVTIFAGFVSIPTHFYIIAFIIGLAQGGVQALSRSLFSQLIPAHKSAEFFGFYNVVGKAAAVFGPMIVGVTASLTGSPRIGMLSILVLFFAGMLLFLKVRESNPPPFNE